MRQESAHKIIELNKKSYNIIASPFSQTRQYAWPDFKFFKTYITKHAKIVDIGCGNGRLLDFLTPYSVKYVGIDNAENLLTEARKKYPQSTFLYADIITDPIEITDADTIIAVAVLNHIPTKELQIQLLKKFYRILKPGGRLLMTNWNLWRPSYKKKSVFKYFIKRIHQSPEEWYTTYGIAKSEYGFKDIMTQWCSGNITVPLYYRAFTKHELTSLLKKAGFRVEQCYYSHQYWYKGGNIITIAKK